MYGKFRLNFVTYVFVSLFFCSASHATTAEGIAAIREGDCAAALNKLLPEAQRGDTRAQKALGELYAYGNRQCDGFQSDEHKSLEWYLRAAEKGDPEAQHQVVSIYRLGLGVTEDKASALKWARKSAAHGNAGDLERLSEFHEKGEVIPVDRVLAYAFRSIAAKIRSRTNRDYKDEYLTRLEDNMSPDQLAEAKNLVNKWRRGMVLPVTSKTGHLLPSSYFQKAADVGNAQALYRLGKIHWSHLEENSDHEKARQYFHAASEKGHRQAQETLAYMYACGQCGPVDHVLSYVLRALSIRGKGEKEKAALDERWEDVLTDEQKAEAKELIATWKIGTLLPQHSRTGHLRKVNRAEEAQARQPATPEVNRLFEAASEGDEQTFNLLIANVQDINDYVINGNTLLHELLLPARSLRASEDKWRKENEYRRTAEHLEAQRRIHFSTLPAKTRMLAVALKHNANISAGTSRLHASALHLAAVYGSPEMVRLLLKQGADPNQLGGAEYISEPLALSLDSSEYALFMHELMTPEQRTEIILQLLAAGTKMPYQYIDKQAVKETKNPVERPTADYLLWDDLVSLTMGAEVLTAMEKTGTTPAFESTNKSVLAFAAQAGNLEGVKWLLARIKGEHRQTRITDAAIWAMYGNRENADAILNLLVGEGLKWDQYGPEREDSWSSKSRRLFFTELPQRDSTLLGHAVLTGRQDWVTRFIKAGAPVDGMAGNSETPLSLAVMEDDSKMVRLLLSLGADPLLNGEQQSPLMRVLDSDADSKNGIEIMTLLLKAVLQTKMHIPVEMMQDLIEKTLRKTGEDAMTSAVIKTLVEGGFPANKFSAQNMAFAMQVEDRGLIDYLIAHGALKPETGSAMPKEYANLFKAALFAKREDLLPALLAAGLDPNVRIDNEDMTASEYAVVNGHTAALTLFAKKYGMPQDREQHQWGTLLDLAVASFHEDTLKAVTNQYAVRLDHACLPQNELLVDTVLKSSPEYWALLLQHGFGSDKEGCDKMVDRIVRTIGEDPRQQLVGRKAQQLSQRLKDLSGNGSRLTALVSAETSTRLESLDREDMFQVLEDAGWAGRKTAAATPAVQEVLKSTPLDIALGRKLVGHYYLQDVREVGSEIVLHDNGHFSYFLAYGAVDQTATGTWQVVKGKVVFRSKVAPAPALYQLVEARPGTAPDASASVVYQKRAIPGIQVTMIGEDGTAESGMTTNEGFKAVLPGPVRQITFLHAELNRGRPWVYSLAKTEADGTNRKFVFALNLPKKNNVDFNVDMTVSKGQLIFSMNGQEMRYRKQK